jgi:hypothetical protein
VLEDRIADGQDHWFVGYVMEGLFPVDPDFIALASYQDYFQTSIVIGGGWMD